MPSIEDYRKAHTDLAILSDKEILELCDALGALIDQILDNILKTD